MQAASTEVCSLWTEGGSWGDYSGQDFVANHGHSAVDFAAIYMWPDNWATAHGEFASAWVEGHVKAAEQLGKPLVFEEFGRWAMPFAVAVGMHACMCCWLRRTCPCPACQQATIR